MINRKSRLNESNGDVRLDLGTNIKVKSIVFVYMSCSSLSGGDRHSESIEHYSIRSPHGSKVKVKYTIMISTLKETAILVNL